MHLKLFTKAQVRLLSLTLVLFTSTTLILARWSLKSAGPPESEAAPGITTLSQDRRSPTQLEIEAVTITPTGFEPSEITRAKGPFILAVDNRSGLDEVELYFERESGSRMDVRLNRKRKLAWREIVDVSPGKYILRAVGYDWGCTLSVNR
jgi:hypothetical protein